MSAIVVTLCGTMGCVIGDQESAAPNQGRQAPPDPFAGLSSSERKRAQEYATLEMVYDVDRLHEVNFCERPDFTVRETPSAALFGVEITQVFSSEAEARLNLVHDYAERLWSGGRHLHKDDVEELKSVRVKVSAKDGTVRHDDLPAIVTRSPALGSYRRVLGEAISGKARLQYDLTGLSHCNLVVLDWFHLSFNPDTYTTERFFDDQVRAALASSPFREVHLIVHASPEGSPDDEVVMPYRIIPLQQMLAMERMYVTGQIVARAVEDTVNHVSEINALTIDHLARIQGFGEAVDLDGRPFLRYRDILLEWSERGLQVREPADYPVPPLRSATLSSSLPLDLQAQVLVDVNKNVFCCGYTRPARVPSTWRHGPPEGDHLTTREL